MLVLGEFFPQILFSLFLNDLTQFMSKCYDGLNLLTDEVHSLFNNQDVEVYFKLYLPFYAEYIAWVKVRNFQNHKL